MCFVVVSGGVLFEGYGHDGPRVYLGDGQTEAEGVYCHKVDQRRSTPAYVPIPDHKLRPTIFSLKHLEQKLHFEMISRR